MYYVVFNLLLIVQRKYNYFVFASQLRVINSNSKPPQFDNDVYTSSSKCRT